MTEQPSEVPETRRAIAGHVIRAMSTGSDEALAEVKPVLAQDVTLMSSFGPADGVEAVLDALRHPGHTGLLAGATWSEPRADSDGAVELRADAAATVPVAGFLVTLRFGDEDSLARIEIELRWARPVPPAPLRLTDDMKAAVTNAVSAGRPIVVAYVDPEGQPRLSLRGSTQVYSDDQLAIWVRERDRGLAKALDTHSRVTLLYSEGVVGALLQFSGRGRVDDSDEVCERVYSHAYPGEQHMDWRRHGVAVIVDLDRVEGYGPMGRVTMARDAGTA